MKKQKHACRPPIKAPEIMPGRVSIIIPVRAVNDYIREALPHLQALHYPDYEIFLFPDEEPPEEDKIKGVFLIPSGKAGPAVKRDMALRYASGEYIAFIDDDAYPREDWLKNAVPYFEDKEVGAVGGPAVTPPEDSFFSQASGKTLESFMCCGTYVYRYRPKPGRYVDDLPSVNLIVRRRTLEAAGGFDSDYYPGEDSKLCHEITHTLHEKIVYSPDVYVWHHRRKLFLEHWKQSFHYGKYRGYFVRKRQKNSLKFSYLVPSLFVIGLFAGPFLCMIFPFLWYVYGLVLLLYLCLVLFSVRKAGSVRMLTVSFLGVITTNIGYGIYYILGFLFPRLC